MGRLVVLGLLALAGCGRIDFAATSDGGRGNDADSGPAQVQRGVERFAISQTTTTVPIVDVDPAHAFLVYSVSVAALAPPDGLFGGTLAANSISFARKAGAVPATVAWEVIHAPELFDVQRGVLPLPGAGVRDATVTISTVDPLRTFVISNVINVGVAFDEDDYAQVTLTGPTSLAFHAGQAAGTGRLPNDVVYQVVSVTNGVAQSGQFALAIGQSGSISQISSDPVHTVAWLSWAMDADDGDIGSVSLYPTISPTELGVFRDVFAIPVSATGTLISAPAFTVTHGITAFAAGELVKTEPIAVELGRSFVVVTGSSTPYSMIEPNDRFGISSFAAELQAGLLVLTRDDATDAAGVTWSVISLGTP